MCVYACMCMLVCVQICIVACVYLCRVEVGCPQLLLYLMFSEPEGH